jgi:hypothetical protein
LTVTAEIGPPVATTLTVVLGATESEPLAGVILRLTWPLEDEDEDDEEDEDDDDEPLAPGL